MTPEPAWPCVSCGRTLVRVVYGLPGGELLQAAREGRVRLGGCTIPGAPICRTCGNPVPPDSPARAAAFPGPSR